MTADKPTVGRITQLKDPNKVLEGLTGKKIAIRTPMKDLQALEKRVAALEDQLPERQSASKVNDRYIHNSCGCVLNKDKNVWVCKSQIGQTPDGNVSVFCSHSCRRCGMPLKYWVEVIPNRQQGPLIAIPGSF